MTESKENAIFRVENKALNGPQPKRKDAMGKKAGIRISRQERDLAIMRFKEIVASGGMAKVKTRKPSVARDITVAQLCGMEDPGMGISKVVINLDPEFQRGFVWGPDREDALINTILENGYVPPVVVGKVHGAKDDWSCVDGGNRIGTIKRFVGGKRAISGLFIREDATVSLDPKKPVNLYVGKKFFQLPEDIQNKILEFEVQVIHEVVEDESSLSDIFVRLNCGGVDMDFGQILLAKYRQTEIGDSIVRFLGTDTAKSLLPASRMKKREDRVSPSGFTKCAEYIATATDFMSYAGKAGVDRFLWLNSSTGKEESEKIIGRFRRAVDMFNRCFFGFEFTYPRFDKDGMRPATVKICEQDRVKAAVVSILYGMDNLDAVFTRRHDIGDRLVRKLNRIDDTPSVLFSLLTIATTVPGRREQAISQIKECFAV